MIRSALKDFDHYFCFGEGLKRAVDFARSNDLASFQQGRYPIWGDKVFALIQEPLTMTEEEAPFEIHRYHADLQSILIGSERVGYSHVEAVTPYGNYDEATDVQNFRGKGVLIQCAQGIFSLFLPHDAHQPYVMVDKPERIKKVVIRIHLSTLNY